MAPKRAENQDIEHPERFATLLEQAPAAMAVVRGPEHVFEVANQMYRQLAGDRDLIGRRVVDALPEVESQGFVALLDEVVASGKAFVGSEMSVVLDMPGEGQVERFFDFIYHPIAEPDGSVSGVFVHAVDVSVQVRTRAQLAASERQLRTMLDAIPTLAWTARADGHIDWYNERWYTYTGTQPADMEGWGWQSVHDPNVLPVVLKRWGASIESGAPFEMTFPLRGADGLFRPFLTRVAPLLDNNGRVLRWFGTNTDVTGEWIAREDAERSAARTRELQSLTAALAGTVTIEDVAEVVVSQVVGYTGARTGLLMLCAPGGRLEIVRQTGLTAILEDLGKAPSMDTPAPGADCVRLGAPIYIEQLDGPDGLAIRYPNLEPQLRTHGVKASATLPLHSGGEVIGVMSYTFDEPRGFPVELREFLLAVSSQAAQAIDRARLLLSERQARGAAEEANAAKMKFLASMSHELRTPLNAIAGYAQLLEVGIHGTLSEDQLAALSRIQRSGQHLLGLINDVLNFAKLEAGHVEYDIGEVRLADLVDGVVPMIEPQIAGRQLTLTTDVPRDCVIRADEDKTQQILLNLLSNAIKFTEPGGSVAVEASIGTPDATVALRVRDSGIGIPSEKHAIIFDPFVQVNRELSRNTDGTGLGLAISRDLARGMGGDLTVESTPGAGSVFTLLLPVARAAT